jgi:hypothetical protein
VSSAEGVDGGGMRGGCLWILRRAVRAEARESALFLDGEGNEGEKTHDMDAHGFALKIQPQEESVYLDVSCFKNPFAPDRPIAAFLVSTF